MVETQNQLMAARQRADAEKRTATKLRVLTVTAALLAAIALLAWLIVAGQAKELRIKTADLQNKSDGLKRTNQQLGAAKVKAETNAVAADIARKEAEAAGLTANR